MKKFFLITIFLLGQLSCCAQKTENDILYEQAYNYYYGKDTILIDYHKAFQIFNDLYNKDYIRAGYFLAGCYGRGEGTAIDESKRISILKRCAELGDPYAQYGYASILEEANKNSIEVVDLYRAAYQGLKNLTYDPQALYLLGMMHYMGNGVKKDIKTAFGYFLKSADFNHSYAALSITTIYLDLNDEDSMWKWLNISAGMGNKDAQFLLGNMYETGRYTGQNYENAYRWYLNAIKLGEPRAMLRVAFMYHKGEYLPQSYKAAFKYFKMSAEFGNVDAQFNVGQYYRNGWWVKKDMNEAKKWYQKAASHGHADAKRCLENLY